MTIPRTKALSLIDDPTLDSVFVILAESGRMLEQNAAQSRWTWNATELRHAARFLKPYQADFVIANLPDALWDQVAEVREVPWPLPADQRLARRAEAALAAISAPKSDDGLLSPSEQPVRATEPRLAASVDRATAARDSDRARYGATVFELDTCCEQTVRLSDSLPKQGDVLVCAVCPNILRYSIGQWFVVPYPPIQATEARHRAAAAAGVADLQAQLEREYPVSTPSWACPTCGRIATWIHATDHNDVYACPGAHTFMRAKPQAAR